MISLFLSLLVLTLSLTPADAGGGALAYADVQGPAPFAWRVRWSGGGLNWLFPYPILPPPASSSHLLVVVHGVGRVRGARRLRHRALPPRRYVAQAHLRGTGGTYYVQTPTARLETSGLPTERHTSASYGVSTGTWKPSPQSMDSRGHAICTHASIPCPHPPSSQRHPASSQRHPASS
jgi:hypothetical protein